MIPFQFVESLRHPHEGLIMLFTLPVMAAPHGGGEVCPGGERRPQSRDQHLLAGFEQVQVNGDALGLR